MSIQVNPRHARPFNAVRYLRGIVLPAPRFAKGVFSKTAA